MIKLTPDEVRVHEKHLQGHPDRQIGNATRDAELRHTQSGKPVSNIRLATNRKVHGQELTQFHTIVCWDMLAETTGSYVKKGDRVPCKRVDVLAAEAQPTCQWATTEVDPDRAGGWPTAPAV